MRRHAPDIAYGLTLIAAILWFAAFVVPLKGDTQEPLLAFAIFAIAGAVAFLAGRLIASRS
jgi:hypothetical protein